MNKINAEELELAKKLVRAVEDISGGWPDRSLGGLEGLAVAIAGVELKTPLSTAVNHVADNLGRIADALEIIADRLPRNTP